MGTGLWGEESQVCPQCSGAQIRPGASVCSWGRFSQGLSSRLCQDPWDQVQAGESFP